MLYVEAKVTDTTHLELAKPIASGHVGRVLVLVAEAADQDAERRQWLECSRASLHAAYGDSEPEYPLSMVREVAALSSLAA